MLVLKANKTKYNSLVFIKLKKIAREKITMGTNFDPKYTLTIKLIKNTVAMAFQSTN